MGGIDEKGVPDFFKNDSFVSIRENLLFVLFVMNNILAFERPALRSEIHRVAAILLFRQNIGNRLRRPNVGILFCVTARAHTILMNTRGRNLRLQQICGDSVHTRSAQKQLIDFSHDLGSFLVNDPLLVFVFLVSIDCSCREPLPRIALVLN